MPLVSVIVPVYNSENHIATCIESICKQTLEDIEIIIINDGSIDNTNEICKNLSQTDKRIKLYNTENHGVSSARNLGLKYAISNFIMFVDSDDTLSFNIIEKLYFNIICKKSNLSMCGYYKKENQPNMINKITEYRCKEFDGTIEEFLSSILEYYYPPIIQGPCWKLFEKGIIEENEIKFNHDMDYGEDLDFVLNYLYYCTKISTIDKCLYTYRIHSSDSLSKKFNEKKLSINIQLAKKLKELEVSNLVYETHHSKEIIAKSSINYLLEVIDSEKKIGKKSVFRIINEIIKNDDVKESIFYTRKNAISFYFLYLLFKLKNPQMIFIVFSLKKSFKQKR